MQYQEVMCIIFVNQDGNYNWVDKTRVAKLINAYSECIYAHKYFTNNLRESIIIYFIQLSLLNDPFNKKR